jgi:hypothetical protein
MSDLSRLLDDLYAMSGTEADTSAVATEEPTRAPAWSSEEALDEVFSSWVPGPSEDAPSAQRSIVAAVDVEAPVEAPAVDAWLQETEPVAVAAGLPRWSPSDDDILPARRPSRRR